MDILLDEMLGLRVQKVIESFGHKVERVNISQFRGYENGELYEIAIERKKIILTCDQNFIYRINPSQEDPSLIIVNIGSTKTDDLVPFLVKEIPNLPQGFETGYVIYMNHEKVKPEKFKI